MVGLGRQTRHACGQRFVQKSRFQLTAIRQVGESVEASLGERRCCSLEAAPGGTRKRAADADAANAERSRIGQCHLTGPADQQVHGLGSHRGHHRANLLACSNPRRIKAVGTRVRIRFQRAIVSS